jgi:hypothetical protein
MDSEFDDFCRGHHITGAERAAALRVYKNNITSDAIGAVEQFTISLENQSVIKTTFDHALAIANGRDANAHLLGDSALRRRQGNEMRRRLFLGQNTHEGD